MATVQVRYIVDDVDAAIGFYTTHLGFTLDMHPAPPFAMLSRGDLRLAVGVGDGFKARRAVEILAFCPSASAYPRRETPWRATRIGYFRGQTTPWSVATGAMPLYTNF